MSNARDFEDFWKQYPRKVGKLAAKRKWDALKPSAEVIGKMFETLAWQIPMWTDPQFIPHPATWLFQGRWLDEPPPTQPAAQTSKQPAWVAAARAKA